VIGQFRDLDCADRYVWMRACSDVETRARALIAFYDGPCWAAHKDKANAMMTEWHDVLLLRPAWRDSGPAHDAAGRHGIGAAPAAGSGFAVTIWRSEPSQIEAMAKAYRTSVADAVAVLVTDPSPNNFPRHPVRQGETVLVGIERGASSAPAPLPGAGEPIQVLRLAPTARSALR